MIVWAVRLALAGVFAVAAFAKLFDQAGARHTVAGFGVPATLVPAGAVAVSLVELVLAVGLVLPGTGRPAAAGAVVLLGVFLMGLGYQLVRGVEVPCACFGGLTTKPVSWRTLARNAALTAAALFVLSQPP